LFTGIAASKEALGERHQGREDFPRERMAALPKGLFSFGKRAKDAAKL